MNLLNIENISKSFAGQKAVCEASFNIKAGEIVALAGESGCGKTTLARIIAGLEVPDFGKLILNGQEINFEEKRKRPIRRKIQMVFQNALGSFNPRHTIGDSLQQPLLIHEMVENKEQLKSRITELMNLVGLEEELINRFPHQVSGGQIQRAAIARAIACKPDLLIADEPTSALDVSIRAQILRLFKELREKTGLSCLVVSHDLPSLGFLADRILVMYKGSIVESGATQNVLSSPKEQYTKRLIAAIPSLNPADKTFEKFKAFVS